MKASKQLRKTGVWGCGILILAVVFPLCSAAQTDLPTALTDKIHKGVGTIDLLKDISGAALGNYINANGQLMFAVDLNEDLGGLESKDSIGVAIKKMELVITTTQGVYTFNDLFTNTTSLLLESGASSAQEFYTLFGRAGSSQITGGTGDAALDRYDDIVRITNVTVDGTITSAVVNVKFLDVASTGRNSTEAFFDWSDGFEDFALVGQSQSLALEKAAYGVSSASTDLQFTQVSVDSAPGTPSPPLIAVAAFGTLLLVRNRRGK